jgi:hypothetical protein
LSEEDDEDEDESGAHVFLVFGGGGGGHKESLEDGAIMGFFNGGICDAHLANRFTATHNASPSSSATIAGGLLAIFRLCLAVASNLFSISFSTSFHYSFIQFVKLSFCFWYCISLFSF